MRFVTHLTTALLLVFLAAQWQAPAQSNARSIVIAHRGASGYRPEHTLPAYELAIDMGADFIEPDLVVTKDGQLVVRHENEISGTTDVANHPEFARRRTTKTIDGETVTGWFTEDFTLSELRTLRARERMPSLRQRNTLYNDRYFVPTFEEVLDLARRKGAEHRRQVGIYAEIKHPSYFAGIGLPLEKPVVEVLHAYGFKERSSPAFIQCFEIDVLKQVRKMTKLPLIQLLDETARPYDLVVKHDPRTIADLIRPEGLAAIADYAQGIGPNKDMLIPRDQSGRLKEPTSLVADAHKAGLLVHAWAFRNENSFLPVDYRAGDASDPGYAGLYGKAFEEYQRFYDLGVDGVFSENPDTAIEARDH